MAIQVRTIDGMTNWTTDDAMSFESNFVSQEGIVVHSGTDLQVQAQTTPDLTVKVKAGTCYVKRDAWTANSGGLKYWEVVVDADTDVTIPANNSGGTIRRIVCVKVDTGVSPDANATNVASLVVVSGVSGGGDPTVPDNHLPLARIIHTNADTSIASGDITDLRTQAGIRPEMLGSNTPSTGQVFTATSPSTAAWQNANAITASGNVRATANTTVNSGSDTDITGASLSITPSAASYMIITAVYDIDVATNGDVFLGYLDVDGTNQTPVAVLDAVANGDRKTVAQTWRISLTAAAHTIKLQGARASGSGSATYNQDHTGFTYFIFNQ
jgi:hypothetical protein